MKKQKITTTKIEYDEETIKKAVKYFKKLHEEYKRQKKEEYKQADIFGYIEPKNT